MTDELRDIEAIRADWALYMAHAAPDAVPPREWHRAEKRLASDAGPLLAALGARDAKLAAVQKIINDIDSECPPDDPAWNRSQWWDAMDAVRAELVAALSLSVPTSPTQTDAELGNEAIRQTAREVALRAVIEDAWGWIMAGRPDEAERQLNDALQSFRPTNRAEKD